MKNRCDLIIHSSEKHLNQIYSGFIELKKKKLIDLNIIYKENLKGCGWTEVILNNKARLIYDTYDNGNIFVPNINFNDVDYYFKRSYDFKLVNQVSDKIKLLGLNYDVLNKNYNTDRLKLRTKKFVKKIVRKTKKTSFYIEDFEFYPLITKNPKICFLTRMWETNSKIGKNNTIIKENVEINEFRAKCIRTLKKEFGKQFIGGVENSEFSRKNYPDCIVDKINTYRDVFLNLLKTDVEICIATTGLHKSIGWKLAEYVAASRAIITEKLNYDLPGNFIENKNYLTFSNVNELVMKVNNLINDSNKRLNIMANNYRYYNCYVRPDSLIMNTLLKCKELI